MQTHSAGDDHTYEVESSIRNPNQDSKEGYVETYTRNPNQDSKEGYVETYTQNLNQDSKEDYVETYTDVDQNAPTYTPLNRNLLESEHLYAAPSPHANSDDLEPDALQDKEYDNVEYGSQASNQIHQLTASSQPNQQKKTPLDPITGEIYSYVNDGMM